MEKCRTDCDPGLPKQDGVSGLSGVQQPFKSDNSADANHDKKPEGCTIVRYHSGGDPIRLTPRFFSLPHILHLVRERYDVVPDSYCQCCLDKILEQEKSGTEILSVDCDTDLGEQAIDPGVGQHLNHKPIANWIYKSSPALVSFCSSALSIPSLQSGVGGGERGEHEGSSKWQEGL